MMSTYKMVCQSCHCDFVITKTQKYCSHKCYWAALRGKIGVRKGMKHSEESIEKMRLAHKGLKINDKQKKNLIRFGEKNNNWKGGITKSDGYSARYQRERYKNPSVKMRKRVERILRRTKTNDLTIETIQLVYEKNIKKYGTLTCYLCILPIQFGKDNIEHKVPLSRGGTNHYNNLEVACQKCNFKKGSKTVEEYKAVLI